MHNDYTTLQLFLKLLDEYTCLRTQNDDKNFYFILHACPLNLKYKKVCCVNYIQLTRQLQDGSVLFHKSISPTSLYPLLIKLSANVAFAEMTLLYVYNRSKTLVPGKRQT